MRSRLSLLFVLPLGILPLEAEAGGSKFDLFDSGDKAPEAICWFAPRAVNRADLDTLASALSEAAEQTMPAHARYEVVRIRSQREGAEKSCAALVDVTVRGTRAAGRYLFKAKPAGTAEYSIAETFIRPRAEVSGADLVGLFSKIFEQIAPAPPSAPAAPDPVAEQVVDEELRAEQARLTAPPPPAPPHGPYVSLLVLGAFANRSIGGAPGPKMDSANVPAIGVQASLHIAELFSLTDHELDLSAEYSRGFATARIDESVLHVESDRSRAGLTYRYRLGGYLPRLGALFGWELLRFEIDGDEDVFSARYNLMRGGLSAVQPLYLDGGLELSFALEGAARVTPMQDGGRIDPGFDVEAALQLELEFGLLARLGARFTRQSGEIGGADFSDRYLDLFAGIGWAL